MIEKNINEALVKKQPVSRALLTNLTNIDNEIKFKNAAVYHQFPIFPSVEGDDLIVANVLFISQEHGVFIFQCREQEESDNIVNSLAEVDRLVYAKILKDASNLQNRDRRSLKIDIVSAIYSDGKSFNTQDFQVVTTEKQLRDLMANVRGVSMNDTEFKELKSVIEGSRGIGKPNERKMKDRFDFENSKGAILSAIESEIHNFDLEQKRAALFVLDGAQRIRGLAGSGKTIILAMKAAMIHLQYPEADILYTYYTKSLNDLIKRLITRFYRQFAEKDPNWDKIIIMHAWGGKYLKGVYSAACNFNNVSPMSLDFAKAKSHGRPFEYVCEQLNDLNLKKQYDYALLDEAQDFPKSFYRLCRQITRNDRVIWAYDDFQNILHIEMQNEKETFGKDRNGDWYIDFEKGEDQLQDMILHKCYRNPRQILVAAFALGLGIYNKSKKGKYSVIQRLESNEHWESLGFDVEKGDSSDGCEMVISRSPEHSATIKNDLLKRNTIRVVKAETPEQEHKEIVKMIEEDIAMELNPEDISVICMDNLYVKDYFSKISDGLTKKGIKSFNLHAAPSNNTIFKVKEHVTLSTIFHAKGNEAGSVYVVGIDRVFSDKNDITERNKIFTAMTRSLAWVTLTGVGEFVNYCIQEIADLKNNGNKLVFAQPSESEVNTIRQGIDRKQKILNKIERMADELAKESDLSKDEIVEQLKSKLLKKK